jgi:hypothetical protein
MNYTPISSDYDKCILLAKNENGEVISACKWGSIWYYVYESKNDGGTIGDRFTTESAILENAYNYIKNHSGYTFVDNELTTAVKILEPVYISTDQKVAINTAYNILLNSNSDHADQACLYLKQLYIVHLYLKYHIQNRTATIQQVMKNL